MLTATRRLVRRKREIWLILPPPSCTPSPSCYLTSLGMRSGCSGEYYPWSRHFWKGIYFFLFHHYGCLIDDRSPPETTRLILQTLLTVVSQPEGAVELLHIEDITPLTEIAPQYPHVLDIINFMWINASTIDSEVQTVRESIDRTMPILLSVFDSTDAVTLIRFAGDFLSKVLPSVSHHPLSPFLIANSKLGSTSRSQVAWPAHLVFKKGSRRKAHTSRSCSIHTACSYSSSILPNTVTYASIQR